MFTIISSKIQDQVIKALNIKKPVVFLGGTCEDNSWREKIRDKFDDKFYLIDPYDLHWDPADNIYDELAGIVNADYVIFYKGKDGTEKEKKFLDNIGNKDYKEFEDLDKVMSFLKEISTKKKIAIADKLKEAAYSMRYSYAYVTLNDGKRVDLAIEKIPKAEIVTTLRNFLENKEPLKINKQLNTDVNKNEVWAKELDPESLKEMEEYNKHINNYVAKNYPQMIKVAKKGVSYDKSSTQINFPEALANKVMSWCKKNVPEEELYKGEEGKSDSYGPKYAREDQIHTTLLYGIDDPDSKCVEDIIEKDGTKPFPIKLGNITAFTTKPNYDVLKIEIESPELHRLNKVIKNTLNVKINFGDYRSHTTIAYLKKGFAEKYINDDHFKDVIFTTDEITFSSKNGKKTKIKLK